MSRQGRSSSNVFIRRYEIVVEPEDELVTKVNENEAASVPFKESRQPVATYEIIMDKFELIDQELNARKTELNSLEENVNSLTKRTDGLKENVNSLKENVNSLKENVNSLTKRTDGLIEQNVNFTINFYVLGLVKTIKNLEKLLIQKYLPKAFSILKQEEEGLQFRDLLQARSHPDLSRGIEEMFQEPLVISLKNIVSSPYFHQLQQDTNVLAHSSIRNLKEFDCSLKFLSENSTFLHEANRDKFLWIKNNYPEIREIIVKLKLK